MPSATGAGGGTKGAKNDVRPGERQSSGDVADSNGESSGGAVQGKVTSITGVVGGANGRGRVRPDERRAVDDVVADNGESGGGNGESGADRGTQAGVSSRGEGAGLYQGRNLRTEGEHDRSEIRIVNDPTLGYIPLWERKILKDCTYENTITVVSTDGRGHLSTAELYSEILTKVLSEDAMPHMQALSSVGRGKWLLKFSDEYPIENRVKCGDMKISDGRAYAVYAGRAQFGFQHIQHVTKTLRIKGIPMLHKVEDVIKRVIVEPANIGGLKVLEAGMELIRFPECMRHVTSGVYRCRVKCPTDQIQNLIARVVGNNKEFREFGVEVEMVGLARRCYGCGGPHLIRDCPLRGQKCSKCGKVGHSNEECTFARATAPNPYDNLDREQPISTETDNRQTITEAAFPTISESASTSTPIQLNQRKQAKGPTQTSQPEAGSAVTGEGIRDNESTGGKNEEDDEKQSDEEKDRSGMSIEGVGSNQEVGSENIGSSQGDGSEKEVPSQRCSEEGIVSSQAAGDEIEPSQVETIQSQKAKAKRERSLNDSEKKEGKKNKLVVVSELSGENMVSDSDSEKDEDQ